MKKQMYAAPVFSMLIALPYLLLCIFSSYYFSVFYVVGVIWFFIICPVVVFVQLAAIIWGRIRNGQFNVGSIKAVVYLIPAYLIFLFGILKLGCAVSA